jgi:hypothetical protein
MTMAAFQRAYADLAASPKLCLATRADPERALSGYDLDAREQARLAKAVWQPGMDANCTLYRATRITANETARFIDWLEVHVDRLPAPGTEIVALARRELAAEESRLSVAA